MDFRASLAGGRLLVEEDHRLQLRLPLLSQLDLQETLA